MNFFSGLSEVKVASKLFWYHWYLKFCKVAIVVIKTNSKYDYGKRKKKLKMYAKVLKELLKYKLLTPEERSKTPEMELVYSWWSFLMLASLNLS